MLTNSHATSPTITALGMDMANDMSVIRRFLLAAAINKRFCVSLLDKPGYTIQNGFGGEQFQLSEPALAMIDAIHASSLTEFIQQLNDSFSNQLLSTEYARAT